PVPARSPLDRRRSARAPRRTGPGVGVAMSETVVGRLARAPDCPRIEAALAAHPAVRAAAVRVQAGPDGRPRVVAHLVPQDTAGEGAPGLENGIMESWRSLWERLY